MIRYYKEVNSKQTNVIVCFDEVLQDDLNLIDEPFSIFNAESTRL